MELALWVFLAVAGVALAEIGGERVERTVEAHKSLLADFIEDVLKCKHCPGLALAVVKDGRVLLKEGYGKRHLDTGDPVDASTLFPIGSLTKVFTALTLAEILKDRPDVDWDTPIRSILGNCFRLPGDFRTSEVCLRDLLAHKVGLDENFLLMVMNTNISRAELARQLQYADVRYPFRTRFLYNNRLFTLAGHVAEIMTGKTYEELVREKIFDGYGMTSSTFAGDVLHGHFANLATSYLYLRNGNSNSYTALERELFQIVRLHAPAGGLVSNADDMARWMIAFLNKTKTESPLTDIVAPQFALDGYTKQTKSEFPVDDVETTYAMGLKNGMYRGYSRLSHSGWFAGFNSLLWLFPSTSIGIFSVVNGPYTHEADSALKRIHAFVADLLLGQEPWLNSSTACMFPSPWQRSAKNDEAEGRVYPPAAEHLSDVNLLKKYEGTYRHNEFGQLTIALNSTDGKLHFKYGNLGEGILTPLNEEDAFNMEVNSVIWYLASGVAVKFFRTPEGTVDEVLFPAGSSHATSPKFRRDLAAPFAYYDACIAKAPSERFVSVWLYLIIFVNSLTQLSVMFDWCAINRISLG